MKTNRQHIAGQKWQNLFQAAGWAKLGLLLLAGLLATTGRAQTNFASAQVLTGNSGSVTFTNTGVVADTNPPAPSTAGFAPKAPLWYQWTAPASGVVELDTLGSVTSVTNITVNPTNILLLVTNITFGNMDTVLAVWTGNSLTSLSQVAANDDLFPINDSSSRGTSQGASITQFNFSGSGDYAQIVGPNAQPVLSYIQPYYGPSHLRFNATAGTSYYIEVDTKSTSSKGLISLQWAYKSSGVFRFATEDIDFSTGLPLYQTSETESSFPAGRDNSASSVVLTYYNYNAPGVLVTVTREAGSVGRCTVAYTTEDGTNLASIPINDSPAVAGVDYVAVTNTLVFDDFEMSKTILIPIINAGINGSGGNTNNTVFGVVLSNPQLDPDETGDVSPPRVDSIFSTALVKILNPNANAYGPETFLSVNTNSMPFVTNLVLVKFPTNVVFNFEKANYRVPEDVNDGVSSPWTQVTLWVERFGTNTAATTLNYRINNLLGDDQDAQEEQNIVFPLQPGSDYAVPTPPTWSPVRGRNSDFNMVQGTISFPSTGAGKNLQPITFTVTNATLTKFNRDFKIQLYTEATINSVTVPILVGMVNETTVTILFNDQNPPAGSVDELYNADFNNKLALFSQPATTPQGDPNPGVSGVVNSLVVLPNNETIIAGDFFSYNGNILVGGNPINNIALIDTNGQLDSSFAPNSGANGPINAVVATLGGQFVIGGAFTSFNGVTRNHVARVNADGSLDASFNPSADDGTVWAAAVQSDGKVLIGGDFTHVNGQTRNHLARLNTDGSLDNTFSPGTTLLDFSPTNKASVHALALPPSASFSGILVGGNFAVSGQSYSDVARFTTNGTLDTTFSPVSGANNVVYALGWQYDGKVVAGGAFTKFNGLAANYIARLNPDGSLDATNFFAGTGADDIVWSVAPQPDGTIYVGGQFSTFNGTHRLGFTRLYANGTVDTTFMDTAYNQFAGLKRIFSTDVPAVYATGVQSDGNVLIGGAFDQVGGGQATADVCNTLDDELGIQESFGDPNLWVEPKTRDGVRNRSGLARLIGGSTPGPGNLSLQSTVYSANKSQSTLAVGLVRTNGTLGPVSANFSVLPGTAQSGSDYFYDSTPPLFWVASQFTVHPSRDRAEGLYGVNGFLQDVYGLFLTLSDLIINSQSGVTVSIINNQSSSGNLSAQFQLANPSGADEFYLGGENIPLGAALGASAAPFTLIDNTTASGTLGYVSSIYTTFTTNATISVVRSNGSFGTVTMRCFATNGTAIAGTDYVGVTNFSLSFQGGVVGNAYNVTVKPSGLISTNFVEKTVNLSLRSLSGGNNAAFGLSNAVLRLINPNFQGYLTLSATNYVGALSSGFVSFVVNRVAGSAGQISVLYATFNGPTATNNVDYFGATNLLQWNNGDASPRIVNIPLINPGTVNPANKQFGVRLFNPTNGLVSAPSLFYPAGSITNATLTISNDNSYGKLQFSAPSYLVNENGGYATITVVRTGGAVGTVSVNYYTSPGANTASGINYSNTTGTLIFAANQIATNFTVPVVDDHVQDPTNFFFNVTLSNAVNAVLGSQSNAVVNILDAETYNWPPGSPDATFTAGMNGDVFALALQTNGQILAGGSFTAVNGAPENNVARLNADGSLDSAGFLNGLAGANGAVSALICQTDSRVVIGGSFTSADGVFRNYIARLMTDGSLDTSFNPGPGANSPVYCLAESFVNGAREIFVGGAFSTISGGYSPYIARLNNGGTLDSTFAVGSGPNAPVYAVAAYPTNSALAGKVLIGGAFTNINGFTLNYLARLNGDGSVDTNFDLNLGAGDVVRAIALQNDGRILIGGDFTNVNGVALNHIARLNTDGTLDTNFTANVGAGANGSVQAIAVQADNRIVLAGQFTQASGVTRGHITRLLPNGAVDPTINFGDGANGTVDALVIQPANQMMVIGGGFTEYDDQAAAHIARIYGGSVTGSGLLQFTSTGYQVDETGGQALITIRRTGGTGGPNPDGSGNISVNFDTSDISAVAGTNYTAVHTTVSFPPGEVLETVPVPVMDDGVVTNNKTVNLAISNPTGGAGLGLIPTAVLTIVNDDAAVSFSSAGYSVTKNVATGVALIDVLRLGTTNGTCSVDFITTTNGSATPGVDFYPTNTTVTFNPGDTDEQIQVPIINNAIPEGYRTVTFTLSNAVNTALSSPSNATLTIIDTVYAPGQFSFSAANYTANESDGSAYLTVVRTNGTSGSVTVAYNTVAGTALPGVNYVNTSGTLTFNGGDVSKTFAVPLVNNGLAQTPVSLSVLLTNPPSGTAALIAPTNATLTLSYTNVGVAFVNATNYFTETNASVPVLVQRFGATNASVQVNYATTNGTAKAGTNYTASSGTLTFGAGQTLSAISLPLLYDPQVTGNLLLAMSLSTGSAGVQLASPSNTVIVLRDADAGLSFTTNASNVYKNAGSALITVICSNPGVEPVILNSNTVPLEVNYFTVDGTAVAGQDYMGVSGTLIFTNGIGTNTFVVPVINNSLISGSRAFAVNLTNATAPGQITSPSNQVVTIIDSNSGLSFSSATYTVLRNGGAAGITVLRTDNTNIVSTVNFATADGTAVAGMDYVATNGTLLFTNGQTSQPFPVKVISSTTVQPDKTVLLQLSNPTNGMLIAPSAATLTIHDTSGSYVVPAGSTLISESGAGAPNGIIDSNETVTLLFAFRDAGGNDVSNLTATLLAGNGVTSPYANVATSPPTQDYGFLAYLGHSVSRQFTFTAHGTNSQQITATFLLTNIVNNVATNLGTALFTYTLGSWTTTFSNTNVIVINDVAPATPYPSSITVSNLGGALIKATMTLTNMTHASPPDINVLLVSPNQNDTLVMSHAGGGEFGGAINGVTLTFDDAASNSLPHFNQITNGVYKPTSFLPSPVFP